MTPLRKLLCIALSVLMITTTAPIASIFVVAKSNPIVAEASVYKGDFRYTIVSQTQNETDVEICQYLGNDTTVTIPAEIDGCRVIGISGRFENCNVDFEKIILSEGIKYIDDETFSCMEALNIELPSTLEYIGENAFSYCQIEAINFPEGLMGIGLFAFSNAKFADPDIVLPKSLMYIDSRNDIEYINENVFAESDVASVYFSDNVRFVNNLTYSYFSGFSYDEAETVLNPFWECKDLEKIEVSKHNPYLDSLDNALYSENYESLIYCSMHSGESFSVPNETKYIMPGAFNYCIIDTLNVGKGVEYLPSEMAKYASINKITFAQGSNLSVIYDYAFLDAELGGDLILPKSLKYIGEGAFAEMNITSLSFETPSSCKTICNKAFFDCNQLESIFIPNSVITLGSVRGDEEFSTTPFTVFKSDKTESIIFEDNSNLTYIPYEAFCCYNIEILDFGQNNSLEVINCNFSEIKGVVDLTGCTNLYRLRGFEGSSFTSVDLSKTKIREISNSAFRNCSNLTEILLPDTVHIISDYAFYNCSSLENFDSSNIGYIGLQAFSGTKVPYLSIQSNGTAVKTYDIFKYYEYNDSIVICGNTNKNTEKADIVIPDSIDGKPVIGIDEAAFYKYPMKSVTIPNTVTYIDDRAFYGCKLEEAPIIPDNVTYLGQEAFADNLENGADIVIPDNVTIIGGNCFNGCKLNSVVIGSSVKQIGSNAFLNCTNTDEIIIPDSVESIGRNAFYNSGVKRIQFGSGYSSVTDAITYHANNYEVGDDESAEYFDTLENIIVSSENTEYSTVDGVLYNKDKTKIIYYPVSKNDESFIMPDSVVEIGEKCFADNKYLKNVTLSANLQNIGDNAFKGALSLSEIVIPSSVRSIAPSAFESCQSLEYVKFEDGVSIPLLDRTFFNCTSLKQIDFDENVSIDTIRNYFISGTLITSIELPDYVNTITDYAFSDKSAESNLTVVTLPAELERLDNYAFYDTSITGIEIPSKIKSIGEGVFRRCRQLNSVFLNNTEGLDKFSFYLCTALESIDLTGVTAVARNAFGGCKNLKKFYFTQEEKEAYIAENEFQGNETIETVVVGSSVTEIKDYAFADCTNLETALIADSVTSIADTAFDGCDNLTIVCMSSSYASSYAKKNSISCTTLIVDPIPDQEYTGKAITPSLNVHMGTDTLKLNEDYRASYSDNINVGTAKATVVGLGDYSIFGTVSRFNIVKTKADEPTPSTPASKPSTPSNSTTAPAAKPNTTTAKPSTSTPTQSTASKTTTTANSSQSTASRNNSTAKATVKTVKLSKTSYTYNGKVKKPSVTVKDSNGKTLKNGTDYTVKYASGRKNVGKYAVKITFKGSYSGSKTLYFSIIPKSTSVSKLKAKAKGFTVKWKKQNKQTTGYQIQYSTSSKFTKAKTVTVSKTGTTSKTVSKLSAKKKYYVRVRTYKTVKVNGKSTKIYSAWSKAKSVKTK